ncbi:ABC transporter permease [Spirochaeta cellobiosiphila]|uniref:ABC transporter permease n=1 Tax=Spirochaeta cellobiosiphila TaxID=504483 RepID=UPI0003F7A047|nr:ABC transporter permease [Spirochaeta cellobiosiphila]
MKENEKNKKQSLGSMLLTIGPMGLWTTIFFLFPFIYILVVSFSSRNEFGNIVYDFTLKAYQTLIRPVYMTVIYRTILMAFVVTFLVILIAYPYAYIAARAGKKIQQFMLMGIIIPFWTNGLLRIYAIMNVSSANGVINSLLMHIGLITEPLQILYTPFAVYFGLIYSLLPLMVMPLYSSLQKIDSSILEAGRDLGASSFQLFTQVIFPLSLPGIMGGVVLVFVPSMFNFYVPDALGGGKMMIIGNVISNQFSISKNWPFGSALAVAIMLFSSLIILLDNKVSSVRQEEN